MGDTTLVLLAGFGSLRPSILAAIVAEIDNLLLYGPISENQELFREYAEQMLQTLVPNSDELIAAAAREL